MWLSAVLGGCVPVALRPSPLAFRLSFVFSMRGFWGAWECGELVLYVGLFVVFLRSPCWFPESYFPSHISRVIRLVSCLVSASLSEALCGFFSHCDMAASQAAMFSWLSPVRYLQGWHGVGACVACARRAGRGVCRRPLWAFFPILYDSRCFVRCWRCLSA